jgi:hypothetical protein
MFSWSETLSVCVCDRVGVKTFSSIQEIFGDDYTYGAGSKGHMHEIFPNVINNIRLAPVGGSEQRHHAPTARSGGNSGH